jgi:hypothetical protein
MKLFRSEDDGFVFHLGKRERELLMLILRQYPVIPPAHYKLSNSPAADNKSNQRLLDEALAEQRNENKKLVDAFLADTRRFSEMPTYSRLKLTAGDIEWLLQVLNDIRVGSWILAGSPEELPHSETNTPSTPYEWSMELSGFFQMNLLHAIRGKT